MATIIDAPAVLTRARVSLEPVDTLAETRSVYSGAEHRLDFGGEWWRLVIVTGLIHASEQAEIFSWADRLRDDDAVARIGVDGYPTPLGTTTATAVSVTASAAAGQRAVAVTNLGAGKTLLARSYVATAANRLHRLRQSVTANGGGAATLELFPRLRDALSPGAVLTLAAPKGLWRLQGRPAEALSRDVPPGYAEPVTLSFLEAL